MLRQIFPAQPAARPSVRRLAALLLGSAVALAAVGCSDATEPGKVVDGVGDTSFGSDVGNPFGKDGNDTSVGIDINLGQTDAIEEVVINPGEFGYPCTDPTDCFSGLCLETANGKQCTTTCTNACPTGYACSEQKTATGDTLFLCASKFKFLCDPCTKNEDCNDQGQAGNICIPFGKEGSVGSFCGAKCNPAASDCPSGYSCNSVTDPVSGAKSSQCQRDDATCTCSPLATEAARQTTCKESNVTGTCLGQRSCTVSGLSDCTAPIPEQEKCDGVDNDCNGKTDDFSGQVKCDITNEFGTCQGVAKECVDGKAVCEGKQPAPESCDKIDNDCDGETDEDLCEDGNPCTKGICNSDGSCLQQQTNGAVCDDGSMCTQTDKCLQGNCLGGNPLKCDDNDPCTTDSCDPFSGCVHQPSSDAVCPDDGDKCTIDQCKAGKCVHELIPEGGLCNDGDDCTVNDKCLQGKCVSGPKNTCDDGNPCTKDYCAPGTGCVNSTEEGDGQNCANPVNGTKDCALGVCSAGKCFVKPNEKCATEIDIDPFGLCPVDVPGTCTAGGSCVADPGATQAALGGIKCSGCQSFCVSCKGLQVCLDFLFVSSP